LPIDLTPIGAPSCNLLVSVDLQLTVSTDANGRATVSWDAAGDGAAHSRRVTRPAAVAP
jgi:hypothetical protein